MHERRKSSPPKHTEMFYLPLSEHKTLMVAVLGGAGAEPLDIVLS